MTLHLRCRDYPTEGSGAAGHWLPVQQPTGLLCSRTAGLNQSHEGQGINKLSYTRRRKQCHQYREVVMLSPINTLSSMSGSCDEVPKNIEIAHDIGKSVVNKGEIIYEIFYVTAYIHDI